MSPGKVKYIAVMRVVKGVGEGKLNIYFVDRKTYAYELIKDGYDEGLYIFDDKDIGYVKSELLALFRASELSKVKEIAKATIEFIEQVERKRRDQE